MIGALNTAATGMEAQSKQIDEISNNLANINTTGYKRSRSEFQDLLYETVQEPGVNTSQTTVTPTGIQRGMGTRQVASQKIMEEGAPKQTGRELDMTIDGPGFFAIQLPDGTRGFTRDGSFKKDANGRIVSAMGFPLDPEINVPQNIGAVTIGADGIVNGINSQNQNVQIGQIQLSMFNNAEGLKARGGGVFVPTPASGTETVMNPGQESSGTILQGHIEMSNVNAVTEMINMIGAQRAYEMNSKVIQSVDQMLQTMNNLK